jgi:hypothetical protein
VRKEAVEKWKAEKRISENDTCGYHYHSADNVEMVEFHVNKYDLPHDVAEEMGFGAFGGNLSVRKPPDVKPLMIFGQDKSLYSQFKLCNCQWVGS